MKRLFLLLAFGCGASLAGPMAEVPVANEAVANEAVIGDEPVLGPVVNATPEAPEEPAEGVQLAGGRLGSELSGLTVGTWTDLEGEFGPAEGIGAPSDHVVERTTSEGTYTLHVVAWESFRQIPEGTPLADFARVHGGDDAQVITAPNTDLGIAARLIPPHESISSQGPFLAIGSHQARVFAQLTVATQAGTLVHVGLACERSAACREDDHNEALQMVALSLRRGPRLRSGGEWVVTLPAGGTQNRRLRIPLPEGFVGLPYAASIDRAPEAYAVSLSDAGAALTIRVSPSAPHGVTSALEPGAPVLRDTPVANTVACAPFHCSARFSRDDGVRAAMAEAWSRARIEDVAADESTLSLAGGRLQMLARGPVLEQFGYSENENETHIRDGDGVLRLRVHDTVRPADEALTRGLLVQRNAVQSNASNVQVIPAGDASLSIRRILPAEEEYDVVAYLLVTDPGGTGIVIELLCAEGTTCEDPEVFTADLAHRLRAGRAPLTGETLHVNMAGMRIAVPFPDDYTLTRWSEENHGGYALGGQHLSGARGHLVFDDGGNAPGASINNVGTATGRRNRVRFGDGHLNLREFRRTGGIRIWGADLGCNYGSCVVLIETDDARERRRLLALLATAQVTLCSTAIVTPPRGGDDTLNLRRTASSSAAVIRQLHLDAEVVIMETRGSWARLAAPNEGWVWAAQLQRICRD